MNRSTGMLWVALLRIVLAGHPVHRGIEMRAGVLAAGDIVPVPGRPALVVAGDLLEREASWTGANCGGSWIVGVAGSSGTVRSTTRMPPPVMPVISWARVCDCEALAGVVMVRVSHYGRVWTSMILDISSISQYNTASMQAIQA